MHPITARTLDSALDTICHAIAQLEHTEPDSREAREQIAELRYDRLLISELLAEQAGKRGEHLCASTLAGFAVKGPEYDGDRTE